MILQKETALFDTGAIDTAITEAGQTASKYLSADSSGIMVYDGSNGEQKPSTVTSTTNNVFIDDNSVDVRKGSTVLSTFGAGESTIGNASGAHIVIGNGAVIFYKDATTEVFRMSLDSSGSIPQAQIQRSGQDSYGRVYLTTAAASLSSRMGTQNPTYGEVGVTLSDINAIGNIGTSFNGNSAYVALDANNSGSGIQLNADTVVLPPIGNGPDLFYETTETLFNTSISGGGQLYNTKNISQSGHYPLAISGWNSPDTSNFLPARLVLSARNTGSGTISYSIKNVDSSSRTGRFVVNVLWLKVSA